MIQGESELQMVERHIRDGERHVANQREIVAHLSSLGHPTELAQRVLRNLEELLAMHRRHLDHIQDEQS